MPRNPDSQKQRLIVVEESDLLRRALTEYLSIFNFIVDEAANGAAFFAAVQRNHYDVVILDIELPDISGFDLTRFIAAKGDAGIIALTARNGRQDRRRGYETGVDLYLSKPVDREELALAAWNLGKRMQRMRSSVAVSQNVHSAIISAAPPSAEATPNITLMQDAAHCWVLERARQVLHCPNGNSLVVSGKEALLLEMMAEHIDKVIHRYTLQSIYEEDAVPSDSRRLDALISRLRSKIRSAGTELPVQIIRGGGIRLLEPIVIN